MTRLPQAVLISSACALSWLLMMALHELGHVLGAWATGGQVERVVLHPLAISRTDVRPNPRPIVVAWMGPVVGVIGPLISMVIGRRLNPVVRDLARFFAGVCLIANGLYLALGSFQRVGDAGELVRHGAAIWHLWLFGAVAVPIGLRLWNGTGPTFGFGAANGRVSHTAALTCLAFAIVVAGIEVLLARL